LIGASIEAIEKGENRESFKRVVATLPPEWGAESAESVICHTMQECFDGVEGLGGYPVVVRPSFTMGGSGSGIAYDESDLQRIAGSGLALSPTTEVLLEESIIGWKEYELEVMRDTADNVVIVCSIENLDPMGVHTGDSITVAPAMTLTDVEYQRLRDISIGIIREVGVDTGGCNIQFAVNPANGRIIVIEMNPRVSRSSALASKATGFPIAKIAAKVAIGYTLDEIPNDITQVTPASFEPTLDYVVVKVPRFAFEKFPQADATLTTHMKSVGEAMAIGRNFTEALQKALRSLERPDAVFDWHKEWVELDKDALLEQIKVPHDGRLKKVMDALRADATPEEIFDATRIDPWFIDQLALINEIALELTGATELSPVLMRRAKRHGFSDSQIGKIRGLPADVVRGVRHALGIRPVYKTVDTCAAEFAATTPYHYSSYDEETEVEPRTKPAVLILGSGPNRIGQGIEFDYSCVHAAMALSEVGYETIMVNCNPETVSTDYDTSDRLYIDPLTLEDVLEIVHAERLAGPVVGVIVQLGGQTPLGLAAGLEAAGVPIVGTPPAAIHLAEERGAFGKVLADANLPAPKHGMATTFTNAKHIADEIGYPVLVRPSYVLGGRGMEIVYDEGTLKDYIDRATEISPERPVLVDRFLDDAIEIDVDALYDGTELFVGGVMEHIEEAGVHWGDSACALPPITFGDVEIQRIRESTEAIAKGVGVHGLINIQFALSSDILYVIEANPRASRTVPFVSKATATPLAKAAARIMLGESIAELRTAGVLPATGDGGHLPDNAPIAVKEAVMPFNRFRTYEGRYVDTLLGPEMRSTGEVMGMDHAFGTAFAKSQAGAQNGLPTSGKVFVSVANRDKRHMVFPVKRLADLGFEILATSGTAVVLKRNGVDATVIRKLNEEPLAGQERSTIVDKIHAQDVQLIINTPHGITSGGSPRIDGYEIRTAAVAEGIPCITTVQGLAAAVQGIEALIEGRIGVTSLQEWGRIVTEGRPVVAP
ncbi:carbamoyl-phosphate synthase large subunit, partial [Aeromicrobium sp.]|uniref:carbamoyl-phosphate synthase large subunit n=1 Tax=Aeromicrobium sp. TaxID=1871063 RepID=UPI0019C27F96